MADRLVLHIGAMKTGTTFLQSVFNTNVAALEAEGVRFLGGRFGVQSLAVRDILNLPRGPRRNRRRWARLIDELRAHPAEVGVVSMEFMSFAGPRHLAAFFEPLDGIEVDVVLTVRDFYRVIGAQWQTYTRNFGTDDWNDYQRNIVPGLLPRAGGRARETFDRAQAIEEIVGRWRELVPAERIHLVTVPGPDAPRDLLWRRFAEAAAIPAIDVDLSQTRDNSSVGFASCDFLRRANVHLGDVRPVPYRQKMRPLINEALAPLRSQEGKPVLDRRTARFANRRNQALRELLSSGVHPWVGDLADLPHHDDFSDFPRHSPLPDEQQVRTAAQAVWRHVAPAAPIAPGLELEELVAAAVAQVRTSFDWR